MSFNRENSSGCPCRGCPDRQPGTGCHDRCERFKAWRVKVDKKNEAERAYHQSNDTMSESKKREMWRKKRYSHHSRGTIYKDL